MKLRSIVPASAALGVFLAIALYPHPTFGQGPLTPPGPPAPTMKALDQIASTGIALNATNTPGDASYHFIISQPGSYYLTGNLNVTKASGIRVTAAGVTIDLNGFQIARASGTGGAGIKVEAERSAVKNGSVSGFDTGVDAVSHSSMFTTGFNTGGGSFVHLSATGCSSGGISAGRGSQVVDCLARNNPGTGIFAEGDSTVTNCTASRNDNGIIVDGGGIVSNCIADDNRIDGLTAASSVVNNCIASFNRGNGIAALKDGIFGKGSAVNNCTAHSNFLDGIKVGPGSKVKDCTASGNAMAGIRADDRCQLIDCSADGNSGSGIVTDIRAVVRHCSAVSNLNGDGIRVLGESLVTANKASDNAKGSGIDSSGGTGSRVEGNQARDNLKGIVASGGDIVIRNSAGNNSGGNYTPSTGTNFAPIQTPSTATNPLANIDF